MNRKLAAGVVGLGLFFNGCAAVQLRAPIRVKTIAGSDANLMMVIPPTATLASRVDITPQALKPSESLAEKTEAGFSIDHPVTQEHWRLRLSFHKKPKPAEPELPLSKGFGTRPEDAAHPAR